MSHKRFPVRFKVGDPVRVVRSGVPSEVARICEVDTKALVPHYLLDFGDGPLRRVADFDLAPVKIKPPVLPSA